MGSKAETLAHDMGADLADSIGVREDTGGPSPTPDRYAGFTRHKGAGFLEIGRIAVDDQIRTEDDPEADDQLVASIQQVGLLQPIRVRWRETDGTWVVLVGHRRYRAAVGAGLAKVPVICVDADPTPIDVIREQIYENCHRRSISPLDEARAYRKYLDLTGEPAVNLANLLHLSQASVSRALSLLTLPAEVQDAIAEEQLSPKAGAEIAKLRNPTVAKQVAARAAATRAPADTVARTVRQKRGTPARATQTRPMIFKVARGVRVQVHGRLDGVGVLEALEAATGMARQLLAAASALEGEQADEQAAPGEGE